MKQRILYCWALVLIFSCKNENTTQEQEVTEVSTPVTATGISHEPMEEYVELNATSAFLQKWIVRANTTGYLQSSNVQLNKYVTSGQVLFTVKTKEAESIGNTINVLDSAFKFSGVNNIKANQSGFISQINHQQGDYVQDGEQLAVITDTKSFVFLLELPYELRPYILNKKTLEMVLPDGEKLTGTISGNMPSMDVTSQTQNIILHVNSKHPIPENLIAKVKVVKSFRNNIISLPKAAVLTDETQSEFWVMKMINDSMAAKVVIRKGIEATDKIEIVSPVFSASDKILVTGNYGLGDTAKVKIIQQ
ncbi:MAG: HlyD family efflux transporter periplasmic adaptor subunit [Sphingobacteriales bacterium]|nr:HlyD family efflux transporter periplasmic adaptor subunit [Sphingobacteriales bacterium]MBI3719372.1 HlyD family efflux transporter periplasmic adaptor subunit [Sphingobacteriales bacterium]